MNTSIADNPVQWLLLDLNAFFASCEQQENPALRGKPVIVVQTPTDTAVAIAASYAAKGFGIKTGTLVRDARQLCPDVITVQANHRLYTEYHERILKAVDTCLPVEKVCSIDESPPLPNPGRISTTSAACGPGRCRPSAKRSFRKASSSPECYRARRAETLRQDIWSSPW